MSRKEQKLRTQNKLGWRPIKSIGHEATIAA